MGRPELQPLLSSLQRVHLRLGFQRVVGAIALALLWASIAFGITAVVVWLLGVLNVYPSKSTVWVVTACVFLAVAVWQAWTLRHPLPLKHSAYITDRHYQLQEVLPTALELPETPASPLHVLLYARVLSSAIQAAQNIKASEVIKYRFPHLKPIVLASALGILFGFLPSIHLAKNAAPVLNTSNTQSELNALADQLNADALSQNKPELKTLAQQAKNLAEQVQQGKLKEQSAEKALSSFSEKVASAYSANDLSAQKQKGLLESDKALGQNQGTAGTSSENATVTKTTGGSREGAQATREEDRKDTLATAPYDQDGKGEQKSEGKSGLRKASGGRGVEGNADRCVEGCLTNDQMNRSDVQKKPDPNKKPPPSGSADSGAQAASGGGGSGLGKGSFKANSIQVQNTILPSKNSEGEYLQVLSDPTALPETSNINIAGTAWQNLPEAYSYHNPLSPEQALYVIQMNKE